MPARPTIALIARTFSILFNRRRCRIFPLSCTFFTYKQEAASIKKLPLVLFMELFLTYSLILTSAIIFLRFFETLNLSTVACGIIIVSPLRGLWPSFSGRTERECTDLRKRDVVASHKLLADYSHYCVQSLRGYGLGHVHFLCDMGYKIGFRNFQGKSSFQADF